MKIKQAKLWKFFSSIKLAIWLLSTITVLSLLGTFIPQEQDPEFYISKFGEIGYSVLTKTGLSNVYSSWWFILFLSLISLNLLVCLLNRFSFKKSLLGTTISHLSILIIFFGAFIGMVYGQKGFVKIAKGEELNSFVTQKGEVKLGFSIRLDDFIYNENIDPKEKLLVYPANKENFCNMHGGGEPLAQISTEAGVESNIADTGYKVKILRYLPDFIMDTVTKAAVSRSAMPNNPAIEAELIDKDGNAKVFWVFARFPDMHQEVSQDFKFAYNWVGRRPKDFISKVTVLKDGKEAANKDIQVNFPLRFGGYTFFQFSFDREGLSWSGLQIVKDPGVPIVYLGFILLILGLCIKFYINPLLKSKEA